MPIFAQLLAAAAAVTSASASTDDLKSRMGVNLSGCEFDVSGALCPTAADVDWYLDQGFTVIRIPFRGSLAPAKLAPAVARVVARGGYVVLDRHDYSWPAPADQIAFWNKFAQGYKQNSHVLIDVMNEPKGFNDPAMTNGWMQWARDANVIIGGLRQNGFKNTVVMEWPQYSSAPYFDRKEADATECGSAACALDRSGGLKDPLGKTLLSPHMYFDKWSSGTDPSCAAALTLDQNRIAAAKRGYRLLLGESAFGSAAGIPSTCVGVGLAAVAEIKAHPETWAGVTWWGGGRAWKEDYFYKIEPLKGTRAKVAASGYLKLIAGK